MHYIVKKVKGKSQWVVIGKNDWGTHEIAGRFNDIDKADDFAERMNNMIEAMESYDYDY